MIEFEFRFVRFEWFYFYFLFITFLISISICSVPVNGADVATSSASYSEKRLMGISKLSQDPNPTAAGPNLKLNSNFRVKPHFQSKENCKKNDIVAEQACLEYCTHFKDYRKGICSEDQRSCICSSSDRNSIRVKLYKPAETMKTSTKKVISDRGDFACDGSLEAISICKVYCDLRAANSSECTKDGRSCLCFTSISGKGKLLNEVTSRNMKQKPGRNLQMGFEEKVLPSRSVGLDFGLGMNRRRRPLLSSRPVQLSPYLPGCNSNSCSGKCPYYCDSLCTRNLECFCSCPEDDIFYEYNPAPPAASYYNNNYDYPYYG